LQTDIGIEDTVCPPYNVAAISIIGIIIATFLLGLLVILVVKFNIYLADKREFAKFEEEREKHTQYKYESPLYKSPVTEFRNPTNSGPPSPNVFELKE
jgi:Integrin beta cytoplasmic domain